MSYLRPLLSGVAALIIALFGARHFLKYIGEQKATDLNATAGGLLASFFSPLFWILAISFFAVFFFTSHVDCRAIRILLFWIPTLTVSTLGMGVLGLLAYVWLRFRNG
jgi:hypothetical protein